MELTKLKIKKITELSYNDVYDLTVNNEHHYITENNVLNHNSGGQYGASITMFLAKAQLKSGDSKVGIIVTAKPKKNRFAIPTNIKFHINFNKGMNAYVGLEQYISWEKCGIEKGKIIDNKILNKLIEKYPKVITQIEEIKLTAFEFNKDTKYFISSENCRAFGKEFSKIDKTIAIKHLGKEIDDYRLFNEENFPKEVLEQIDVEIKDKFGYHSSDDIEELDELLSNDSDDISDKIDDEIDTSTI